MHLSSGHTVEALQGEELERQERDFKGYTNGMVRLNPGRWLFPVDYTKFADSLYGFKFRKSDVVVMTWPKCGTTWMQEILWTMRNNPDLDNPQAMTPNYLRVPFLDLDMLLFSRKLSVLEDKSDMVAVFRKMCPDGDPKDGYMLQIAQASPDPRTIKTHLPFSLLNPELLDTAKVVYVARNPKDVVVSYHHHSRLMNCHAFTGSFDQFVHYFVDDDLLFGPYWLHLKEAWAMRDHPNMHFVFYEDLKSNNMIELQKLNQFLDTNLTEEQLQKVAKYTDFSVMKARENEACDPKEDNDYNQEVVHSDGGFFREGVVGNWKQHLNRQQQDQIDQWMERNMKDFSLSFPYSS